MATSPLQTPIAPRRAALRKAFAAALEARLEAERERIGLWLPVALGAGIAAWLALPAQAHWIGLLLLLAAGVLGGLLIGWRSRTGRVVAVGCGVMAAGMLLIWGRALWVAAPVLAQPVVTEFSALVERVDHGLVVEVALTPIALFHFHEAGLYGALANVVAIPLTTFVVMPAEALALLFDSVGLGAPFWWVAEQALRLLIALAHTVAGAPGAVTTLPSFPPCGFGLALFGGLWILLWKTRWRRWGMIPLAAGAAVLLAQPRPDLLVTGDGRHIAAALPDGSYALLRGRAGDYVRDSMDEAAGIDARWAHSPISIMSNATAIFVAGPKVRGRRAASSSRRAGATGSRVRIWPRRAPPPTSLSATAGCRANASAAG